MNITQMLTNLTMGRALTIGFAIAGIYYFIFFDSGAAFEGAIANKKSETARIQAELNTLNEKINAGLQYQKTVNELGGTMDKLLALVPERFGREDLMKIVSNEAKMAGSNLVRVNFVGTPPAGSLGAGEVEAPDFQKYQVDVELNGSFVQHMIFLSSITKINQILTVNKLTMDANSQYVPNEPVMIKMNASIVAYRYLKGKNKVQK